MCFACKPPRFWTIVSGCTQVRQSRPSKALLIAALAFFISKGGESDEKDDT